MADPRRIEATVRFMRGLSPRGIVLASDLVEAGVTRHRIVAAERAGAAFWLRRGVIALTDGWNAADDEGRLRMAVLAAAASYPSGVAAGDTAARLHGLPVFAPNALVQLPPIGRDPGRAAEPIPVVHFAVARQARWEGWLRLRATAIPPHHAGSAEGVPVTGVLRTAIDCAATCGLPEAVAVLDAAQRLVVARAGPGHDLRRLVREPKARDAAALALDRMLDESAQRPGIAVVRRAAAISTAAAESVLESISRVRILRAGLPVPECGLPVRGADGMQYWADIAWPGVRILGEADGMGKYVDIAVLRAEKRRQEALENAGWMVVRWTWDEAVTHPEVMIARLRMAFARRAV